MGRGRFGFKVSSGPKPEPRKADKSEAASLDSSQSGAESAQEERIPTAFSNITIERAKEPSPGAEEAVSQGPATTELASGRKIIIDSVDGQDSIKIMSADNGPLEIEIEYTETGPKVKIHQGSLEITAAKDLAIDCQDLKIRSQKSVSIESEEGIKQTTKGKHVMLSEDDTVIRGKLIHLN